MNLINLTLLIGNFNLIIVNNSEKDDLFISFMT
jgi:hypothetical protein